MANIIISEIKDLVELKDILAIDSVSNTRLTINENFHKLRRGLFAIIDALGLGDTNTTYIDNSALPPDIVANSFSTPLAGPPYNFRVDTQGFILGRTLTVDRSTSRRINLTADPTTLPIAPGEIRWDGSDFLGWDGSNWISFTAGAAGGEVTDATNVGTGTGVFLQKVLNTGITYELQFKTLVPGTNVSFDTTNPNHIVINSAGISGVSGVSGFSGSSGVSGFSGRSGFSGPSGVSGFSGQTGQSGYSGSGISGFSGAAGAAAASGFSGYSGPSGYSGFSGASGRSGYSGYSGYSGDSGISGFSGRGISGFSGVAGDSGFSGFSGGSGNSGFSGFSGVSGRSGFSGYSGPSGISGFSGEVGAVGQQGDPGPIGPQGFSGFSGLSGISGTNGISGFSGFSGRSGFSGSAGTSGFSGFSGTRSFNYIRINYNDLLVLRNASNLATGSFYLIQNLAEPLVVFASELDKIDYKAYSPVYPQDEILYDFVNNNIIYRKDTVKNLSAWYDWRTITFTRWETASGNGVYTSPSNTGYGSISGFYTFGNTIDFNGVFIPGDGSGGNCFNVHIGRSDSNYWGPGYDRNNIVMGNTCSDIIVHDNTVNCTFGDTIQTLTIGPESSNIIIAQGSYAISLGSNCNSISIGQYSSQITLGHLNDRITIGDFCTYITMGSSNGGSGNEIYFGNGNLYITIGVACADITFVDNVGNISIGSYLSEIDVVLSDEGCVIDKNISNFIRDLDLDDNAIFTANTIYIPARMAFVKTFNLTSTSNSATVSQITNLTDNHSVRFRATGSLEVTWQNTPATSAANDQLVTEGSNPISYGSRKDWIEFLRDRTTSVLYKINGANYI